MLRLTSVLLAVSLLIAPASAAPAFARPKKPVITNDYHRAFQAIAAGNVKSAEDIAAHGPDRVLDKVITGYAMAMPGNEYSFDQLNDFLRANPDWPGLKFIRMITEQKLPPNQTPAATVAWFADYPPLSLSGFYRFADALNANGQARTAEAAIRQRWIDDDMTGDEQTAFVARYGSLLDDRSMAARLDRLLWKNDVIAVRRLLPSLTPDQQNLAEARLALAAQTGVVSETGIDGLAARVPASEQNDPGLLFQRLRLNVKAGRDAEADFILLHPPEQLGNAEAWWDQRQIMARRALAQRDYALAYQLAALHGQSDSKTLVQAEFLCGWLALRYLNQPDAAHKHFQTLYDNASTPMSRSRGSYWLGRAYEAQNDKNAAEQAYEDAAAFNSTYYGQLAMTRLYAEPVLTAKADPALPAEVQHRLMARDLIQAILRLYDIGEGEHARAFFHAAVEDADQRAEFIILTEVAAHMRRPDLAITAIKAANQKNMLVENGGYPLIDQPIPAPPESAFTHALIRQESMFNPDVASGVGARGLMQLMPRTAREVAKKLDINYSEKQLSDPGYSLKLGTAFVEQQIEHFNGSYILALAGYNAGPGRVREWIAQYGDPRSPDVDPIDWVETIPIYETRNYVQRIIENIQVYRAKLAGGHAPLMIAADLKK